MKKCEDDSDKTRHTTARLFAKVLTVETDEFITTIRFSGEREMLLKEILLALVSLLVAWFLSASTALAEGKNEVGNFSRTSELAQASFFLKASSPLREKEIKCRQASGIGAKYFCAENNKDSLQAGNEEKEASHEGQKRDENDSAKFLSVTRSQSSTTYPLIVRLDNHDGLILEFIDPH